MNDRIEWMITRRSCRSFKTHLPEKEALEQIVLCACHAPSARNRQAWQFTVLTEARGLERLYTAVGEALEKEAYDFYGAPCLILCSAEREHPYGREDCACAMENMYLASHALSLGMVWINQLTAVCDKPEIRAILREIGVPDDHVVYGSAAIGYAAGEPTEKTVKENVVWH